MQNFATFYEVTLSQVVAAYFLCWLYEGLLKSFPYTFSVQDLIMYFSIVEQQ